MDLLKETINQVVIDAKKGRYNVLEECLPEENYLFIPQIIIGVKEELNKETFKRFLTAQTKEFKTNGEEQNVENAIYEFLNKYKLIRENTESDDEFEKKFKKIREFVENDNRDLLRILVINKDGEYEERYDFNNNINNIVKITDKKIVALSEKNYECILDCCDNCMHEEYNEETDEYECEEHQDIYFCAVENQFDNRDHYEEILWSIQGVYD